MAKMFVRYSGNKAAFLAAGLETTYAKSIVFIGGGECIWANGNYYASSAEIQEVVNGFSWFSQISDGTHTAKTNAKDGVITFSAIDPASVEVLVDTYGVKFGLKEEFVKAVNEVLPARIKAIEDDYLKGADKTELQDNIDAVIGTAEDTMESKTIEGLYKRIDEKTSGIASEGVVTDLSNRVKAIEDAPYATTDNVATAKSEVIGTEGDAATADTVKGAKAFATSAVNTAKTEILGAVEEADAKTIAALNDKIEAVSADAKSYSIAKVEGTELEALGANVKEAFKLVDEDGAQAGNVIAIYKDSSVKEVKLVEQELQITYILADGSESTVGIDVSKFLAESEFAEGLQVVNGVVSVKVDPTSEGFLSVSSDGVKVSGITEALDAKIGKDDAMLDFSEATTEVYNLSAENPSTPVLTGNLSIQSFEESHPGGQNVEVIVADGDATIFMGAINSIADTFKCVDGVVTYEKKLAPDDVVEIQHTLSSDGLTIRLNLADRYGTLSLTMNVEKGDKLNTQDSLVYLNNTKADKAEVAASLDLKADKSDIDALDLGVKEIYLGHSDLGDVVRLHDASFFNADPDADLDYGYAELESGSVYFSKINHDRKEVLIGNVVGFDTKANTWEVEAALDAKIGKDDVMLGSEELLSSWTGNGLLETPYMTNNWSARVEGMGGEYIPTTIYNENDEVIFVLPSFEELGARGCSITGFIYTHNNGELSILVELMDAPKNYTANIQIDPTSTYKLVFGDNAYYVKLTGDIYAELPTNTKKSFEKLNKSIVRFDSEIKELDENKADKISLNQHVLQFYELKGNVRDIESSLALKADKTEVESTISIINETLSTKLDASAFEWEEL